MSDSSKKKFLKVFVVSFSGKRTIRVCYSIFRVHPLYKRTVSRQSSFLIDISEEDILRLKENHVIEERKEIYVDIACSRISKKKIGRFVDIAF